MTPEQKNIECAKLDGFVKHPTLNYYYRNGDIDGNRLEDSFSGGEYAPAYFTSYDAIIPVIQKQNTATQTKVFMELQNLGVQWALKATPSQLQDALLRAHGFEV